VWAACVVDRCRRHTGLDQLDPPTIHDGVVRRRSDGHGPAEVMGDAETHATNSASGHTVPGSSLFVSVG
jgi:hypothetical protein